MISGPFARCGGLRPDRARPRRASATAKQMPIWHAAQSLVNAKLRAARGFDRSGARGCVPAAFRSPFDRAWSCDEGVIVSGRCVANCEPVGAGGADQRPACCSAAGEQPGNRVEETTTCKRRKPTWARRCRQQRTRWLQCGSRRARVVEGTRHRTRVPLLTSRHKSGLTIER